MRVEDFLRQNLEADLLRLSTCGSVDDGKSTLIGRMLYESHGIYDDQLAAIEDATRRIRREDLELGLLTDGLQAEREQGITIDVAYRYFSTPRRRFIIADTPGHEQYTRNMVTGASTANLALILIDARNGVLTQTCRHAFIASLLAIPHLLVAVNKMDLVGWSRDAFEEIRGRFEDFTGKLSIQDVTYVPVSALQGDNVVKRSETMPWYRGPSLMDHLQEVYVGADRNLVDLRFPVQYVIRPEEGFRAYAGEVASGVIRRGDEVLVLPSGARTRVKAILTFEGEIEYAFPPMSVSLLLENELDISRGDMIVHPGNLPKVLRSSEAIMVWMSSNPLQLGRQYQVKHTTNSVRCHVSDVAFRIDPDTLSREEAPELRLNEIGRTSVHFYRPVFADDHQRNRRTGNFIVIDPITNETVGAGMLIDRGGAGEIPAVLRDRERPKSSNITRNRGRVDAGRRRGLLGHGPATVWLTGLSGSGKSTIAYALEERLVGRGCLAYVLDGDNIRHGLNRDLGFAPEEREENIRRVSEVARLLNEAGAVAISAFISPYRRDRRDAREVIGPGRFVEVFVDTPLEICEARDPRGLYRRARRGEIKDFTGISAPYEPPEAPEVHLQAGALSVEEAVDQVMDRLEELGILDGDGGGA